MSSAFYGKFILYAKNADKCTKKCIYPQKNSKNPIDKIFDLCYTLMQAER